MIDQFRRLNPVNILLLIVLAVVLRLGLLLHLPEALPLSIFDPVNKFFPGIGNLLLDPLANVLLTAVLVVAQGLWVNRLVNEYNLLSKPSFLPALLFVTVSSLLSPFLTLNLPLVTNFLMIGLAQGILSIHRKDEARSVMYNLGMVVGLGTLLYFPFIAMLVLLWISLILFRPFNWREWLSVLMGFLTVYFFIGFFYYWTDSFGRFYQIWLPLGNKFVLAPVISRYDYITFLPVAFIFVLAAFSLQKNFFRSYVQIRKSFQALFAMSILAILCFYLDPDSGVSHFLLAALPAAVFMAYYFLNARIRWFYESVYVILVGMIVWFQFF